MVTTLEIVGQVALFIDVLAVGGLLVFAWIDLRRQTTDVGKIGGVTALIALCFVFYFVGRAFLAV